MKGFMKFCLMLAVGLGFIGLVGVGVGMAMGARPYQFLNLAHYDGSIFHWLENRTDRLEDRLDSWSDGVEDSAEQWSEDLEDDIDDWSSDLEDRVDDWADGWEHHWEDEWEHGGGHRGWSGSAAGQLVPPSGENIDTFEDSFAAGDVERLEMDLNYAILQITAGPEDGDIQLKGRNARSYFRSALEGGTLRLEDTRTHAQCQREQALELELVVPARQFREIELELGASDAYIERLHADSMRVDVGAGLLKADSLQAEELELDAGVGSGTVERLEAPGWAELDVGTGELTVKHFKGGSMNLDCGVGTLEVTAAGSEKDYNYTLDCGIGSIRLGSQSYSGLDRSASIDNGADKTITADCGIGMISLDFE